MQSISLSLSLSLSHEFFDKPIRYGSSECTHPIHILAGTTMSVGDGMCVF